MLRLCRVTSDWTAGFVTDELADTLIAEHVPKPHHIHIYLRHSEKLKFGEAVFKLLKSKYI